MKDYNLNILFVLKSNKLIYLKRVGVWCKLIINNL